MDRKFISELRERLENKSLDDLKKIWIENNRDQWAGSTFEVIRQILIERGEEIPPQNEEIPPQQELPIPDWLKKKRKLRLSAGLLFLIVIVCSSLNVYVLQDGSVFIDTFTIGCLIASIVLFIKSFFVKAPKEDQVDE